MKSANDFGLWVCKDCGVKFIRETKLQRLCPDCKNSRLAANRKEYRKRFKKPEKDKPDIIRRKEENPKPVFDNEQCATCLYRWCASGDTGFLCDYKTLTGHRRPCEPPPGCTAYKEYDDDLRKELTKKYKALPPELECTNVEYRDYQAERIAIQDKFMRRHGMKR